MHPLYVDISDEVTTVIERLKEAPETEIALVIPKNALLLQSIVNLKLVRKAANDSGKELTIVTTDKIGRNLAAQVGIANLARLENTPDTQETQIVGGIKVHNYYDDEEKPEIETIPENSPAEPIVPISTTPEPVELEDTSPITIREFSTIPRKPSSVEVISPRVIKRVVATSPAISVPISPQQKRSRTPFIVFLLILILIGAGTVSAYYLPKTEVTISAIGKPWTKTYVSLAATGKAVDTTHLTTAQLINATESSSVDFQATGSKDIGNQAHGTATLSYVQDSNPQTVPAGTTLSANGIVFTTDKDVTVPGAKVANAVPVAGSASVPITASSSGTSGNMNGVAATVTSTSKLYGEVVQTSGGTSQRVAVITDTDIANAKQQLQTKLQTELVAKIGNDPANHPPSNDPTKTDSFTLTDFTSTPSSGTQADSGSATATGTLKRLVYDPSQLDANVRSKASQESIPNMHLSVLSVTDTVQDFDLAKGTINFSSSTSGTLTQPIDTELIRKQIIGKTVGGATSLVQGLVSGSSVTIVQNPKWWPLKRLPYSNKYVHVHTAP